MKYCILILKKIIRSFLLLFGLNVVIKSLGIVLPINFFNLIIITVLGIPGLLSLLIIKIFII